MTNAQDDIKNMLKHGWRAIDCSYEIRDGGPAVIEVTYVNDPGMERTAIDDTVDEYLLGKDSPILSVMIEEEWGGRKKAQVKYLFTGRKSKSAAEIAYPDCQRDGYWDSPSDYRPLIDSLGHAVELCVEVGSYSGDTQVLLRDGQRFGILSFGWGSCSGCDALQACDNYEEIDELRAKLADSIVWKDSAIEMAEFMMERDWESQPCWHSDEEATKKFVSESIEILSGAKA